jgi:hypothetical protein
MPQPDVAVYVPPTWVWFGFAHETRIAGDDAAHPTTLGKVEQNETKESLDFMDEFLEHTIARPSRRESRKQARSAWGRAFERLPRHLPPRLLTRRVAHV